MKFEPFFQRLKAEVKKMGEYAKRKSDNKIVKIGTQNSMFYLRYEDRDQMTKEPGSLYPATTIKLFWRLPFPDEDDIKPGEYKPFDRGQRLYKVDDKGDLINFSDPRNRLFPSKHQYDGKLGKLSDAHCFHGEKLSDDSGKNVNSSNDNYSYELAFVTNTVYGLLPIVKCRNCLKTWCYNWNDIAEYIPVALYRQMQKKGYFDTEKAAKLHRQLLDNLTIDQLKAAKLQA